MRSVARAMAIVYAVMVPVSTMLHYGGFGVAAAPFTGVAPMAPALGAVVTILTNLLVCACGILLLVHLRRIARRGTNRALVTNLTWLLYGFAAVQVLAVAVTGLSYVAMAAAVAAPVPAAAPTNAPAAFGVTSYQYQMSTSVAVSRTGTSVTTTGPAAVPAAPVAPALPTALMMVMSVLGCGTGILWLVLLIIGIIALVRFRQMLLEELAAEPVALPVAGAVPRRPSDVGEGSAS